MTTSTRQKYERQPEVKLKRWVKNHDPEYIKKRTEYSNMPIVKDRRKALNRRRRQLCSTLIALMRKRRLQDSKGNRYKILNGRLIKNDNKLLKADKHGDLVAFDFQNELELLEDKFDRPLVPKEEIEFLQLLDRYQKGDEEVIAMINRKRKTLAELTQHDEAIEAATDEAMGNTLKGSTVAESDSNNDESGEKIEEEGEEPSQEDIRQNQEEEPHSKPKYERRSKLSNPL
jgi:hypothetical protein